MKPGRTIIPLQTSVKGKLLRATVLLLLCGIVACSTKNSPVSPSRQESEALKIERMVAVEELILELTPKLELLKGSVMELKLPNKGLQEELFAEGFNNTPISTEHRLSPIQLWTRGILEGRTPTDYNLNVSYSIGVNNVTSHRSFLP